MIVEWEIGGGGGERVQFSGWEGRGLFLIFLFRPIISNLSRARFLCHPFIEIYCIAHDMTVTYRHTNTIIGERSKPSNR